MRKGLTNLEQGGEEQEESKSIIRLTNDLHACTGYKGNHMERTRDRLANETTVNELKQRRRGCGQGESCREISTSM